MQRILRNFSDGSFKIISTLQSAIPIDISYSVPRHPNGSLIPYNKLDESHQREMPRVNAISYWNQLLDPTSLPSSIDRPIKLYSP
jgi:hypothetical protein